MACLENSTILNSMQTWSGSFTYTHPSNYTFYFNNPFHITRCINYSVLTIGVPNISLMLNNVHCFD